MLQMRRWISPTFFFAALMTCRIEGVQSMTKHTSMAFAEGAREEASHMAWSSFEALFSLRAACCLGGKSFCWLSSNVQSLVCVLGSQR